MDFLENSMVVYDEEEVRCHFCGGSGVASEDEMREKVEEALEEFIEDDKTAENYYNTLNILPDVVENAIKFLEVCKLVYVSDDCPHCEGRGEWIERW